MSASYKGMKYLISIILAIVLDGAICYFLPSYFNKINYFYPMFTVSLIPFLSVKNNSKNNIYIIILGLLYNILYSNIFLFHIIVFILLSKLDYLIISHIKENIFLYIILVSINIVIYDSIYFILILITSYQDLNILDLLYKIKYSLLNILSVFVYWFIIKKRVVSA